MPTTRFRIQAIPRQVYEPFLELSDLELTHYHARWIVAEADLEFPCRVSLQDAKQGERLLAISHLHHDSASPYRAAGPIFVRKNCETARPEIDEVPIMLRHRLLSLRGYSEDGNMLCAQVVEGSKLEFSIADQFQFAAVKYQHIHNAMEGCVNCAVQRIG